VARVRYGTPQIGGHAKPLRDRFTRERVLARFGLDQWEGEAMPLSRRAAPAGGQQRPLLTRAADEARTQIETRLTIGREPGTRSHRRDGRFGAAVPFKSGATSGPGRVAALAIAAAAVVIAVAACGSPGPTASPTGPAVSPLLSTASPVESGPAPSLAVPTPEVAHTARIPVVACPTTYGLPGESMGTIPSTMTATVTRRVAAEVTFYSNGTQTLLGPSGWQCEGAVGVDGSSSMVITPQGQATPTGSPSPGHQAVTAFSGGACVGCIATMACGLFPEAWKLFDQPGLSCPTTSPPGELVSRLFPSAAVFEDPPGVAGTGEPSGGQYRALGLMVFDPGTGAGGSGADLPSALKITCTLSDALAQVCDEIVEGAP